MLNIQSNTFLFYKVYFQSAHAIAVKKHSENHGGVLFGKLNSNKETSNTDFSQSSCHCKKESWIRC